VEVQDVLAAGLDGPLDGGLLDVHVERIEKQPQVGRPDLLDEREALRGGVDQCGLVAVQGLERQAHAESAGSVAALAQRGDHPPMRLLSIHPLAHDPAQQPDDDEGVQASGDRDVRLGPLDGCPADGRIDVAVGEALLPPSLPRADGGHGQAMRTDQRLQFAGVHQGGIADSQFYAAVSPRGDPGDVLGEVPLQRYGLKLCGVRREDKADLHSAAPCARAGPSGPARTDDQGSFTCPMRGRA